MKKLYPIHLLIYIIVFCQFTSSGQVRQIYLDTLSVNNETINLSFFSSSEGYISSQGSSNTWVGYSNDSGRTITKRNINSIFYQGISLLPTAFTTNGVKAFNKDQILVYGAYFGDPAILSSADGGITYDLIYHSTYNSQSPFLGITDMVFPGNNAIGFAVDQNRILKTNDKGKTWSRIRNENSGGLKQIKAVRENVVFAFSSDMISNELIVTLNGGGSWQDIVLPVVNDSKILYCDFINEFTGWVSTVDADNVKRFYKTSDGGITWNLLNEDLDYVLYKFKFTDETTGYGLTGGFITCKTSDGGSIWEPLIKDNNFSYLGYSHNDIQCISSNQFWAAGAKNFMEISTNGGGTPFPKAFFKIDTSGSANTSVVNLVNKSKTSYNFKWYVNSTLISTSYNASYNHIPDRTLDTITLISSNGIISDTVTKYQYYPSQVKIFSFTPTEGVTGTVVTITGKNFLGVSKVYFGGVLSSNFTILSDTQIIATVSYGASGAVMVKKDNAYGILNGFKYLPPPQNNLSITVSDSILCKSEATTVLIQSSEIGVEYDLLDSLDNLFGRTSGNGSTALITTSQITSSTTFKIKAYRVGYPQTVRIFDRRIFIKVEKTRSVFTPNRINILESEFVSFGNQSIDASSFIWQFNQDASIKTSENFLPGNVSYNSEGQKTLSLISISDNGCRDTLTGNAVFVYKEPAIINNCTAEVVREYDTPNFYCSLNPVMFTADKGLLVTGSGNKPYLESQFGSSKIFNEDGVAFISKFTKYGILSWTLQINQSGRFYESAMDQQGNLYVLGSAAAFSYLKLINGDSIHIASSPSDSTSDNEDGFILKLDPDGNYIWHAVFDDPSLNYQGYPRRGGIPYHISLKDDHLVIAGNFLANLAYCKNGISKSLVSLTNSTFINDLQNCFLIKIDTSGSLKWYSYIENGATNGMYGVTGLKINSLNNVLLCGNYEDFINIRDKDTNIVFEATSPSGSDNSYIIEFNSSGQYIWYDDIKGNRINNLALDEQNNIYITGAGAMSSIKHSNGFTKSEPIGAFNIMKFAPSGINKWITGFVADTSFGGSNIGHGYTVSCKGNNLYVTGGISLYNGDSTDCLLKSADGNDLAVKFRESEFYIINYDTSGILKRVVKSGINNGVNVIAGSITPNKLLIDQSNNFIISGIADCNNNDSSSFVAFNHTVPVRTYGVDGFILKLDSDYCYSTSLPVANAGEDKTICSGQTVSIGKNEIYDGYSYYWKSSSAPFISASANPYVMPDTTTTYFLTVINKEGLLKRDTVTLSVTKTPEANAGKNIFICSGDSATIGSLPINGNYYFWTADVGNFTSNLAKPSVKPNTTTNYYLSVSNNSGCVGNDTVTVFVNDSYNPTVALGASADYICEKTKVIFTAVPFEAGDSPSFQWLLNGSNVGTNTNIYISDSLKHNDIIKVRLTSSFSCANPKIAESNEVTMFVIKINKPEIIISGNTSVTFGQSSNISTFTQNEGGWPAFIWEDSSSLHSWKNNSDLWGNTIQYTPLENGQKLRCILRSTAECAIPQYDTSNVLTFMVSSITDINTPFESSLRIYPNPVTTNISIDNLKQSDKWETVALYNQIGQKFLTSRKLFGSTKAVIDVSILPPGLYYLILTRKTGKPVYYKFIKL